VIPTGKLKHRITIERNAQTVSGRGAVVDSWSQVASRMAAVEYVSGREYYANQQLLAEATIRFGLQFDSSLQIDRKLDRVKFGTRYFDILDDVNVDFANREIWLLCKEIS
jgi:SPP1 family predicted phage head-tail adaptor